MAFANFLAATPAVKGTGASALADFNNDGYADYADHYLPTGAFWIHQNRKKLTPPNDFDPLGTSSGGGTVMPTPGSAWRVLVADFTGDGHADYADYADYYMPSGQIWVHENDTNNGFYAGTNWATGVTVVGSDWQVLIGDFTGDGRADLAEHQQSTMHMNIHRNLGVLPNVTAPIFSGVTWRKAYPNAGLNWYPLVGDFTGDGCADYANLYTPTGQFYVVEHQSCTTFPAAPPTWGIGTVTVGVDWRILGQWQ